MCRLIPDAIDGCNIKYQLRYLHIYNFLTLFTTVYEFQNYDNNINKYNFACYSQWKGIVNY